MKPIPFKIPKSNQKGLLVQVDELPYFYSQLHYHPEYQITAIEKGQGIFYAGNTMSAFKALDIFIIGPNVPHLLKCPDYYYSESSPGIKGISLFFDKMSFGKYFFDLKEMEGLKQLLKTSNRIIKISGVLHGSLFDKIVGTPFLQNEQLIIAFLEILSLSNKAQKVLLNSYQYNLTLSADDGGRLDKVLAYTFKNFKEAISIAEIAKVAFLSRSQFSAFFKLHTGKTYIQFLNELRVENACILLKNQEYTVEQVCYEVGFQNVSNFTRQFKKVKNSSPSGYRKSMLI